MDEQRTEVRAFYWAARVSGARAPFDTVHLKIYYPGRATGSEAERMTGVIPADATRAPFPAVVFVPGVNVTLESYRWLAVALALQGYAVVATSWIGELFAGQVGISAGLDLDALRPETYGEEPPVPLLSAVLAALAEIDAADGTTPLSELLDLDRIIVGGHSAGGSAALQAACHRFYPDVVAAFAYGAHSGLSTMLGWPPGAIGRLAADCPLLLLGGTNDGVIAASAARYGGASADARTPLLRTLEEGVASNRGDAYLFLLDGASHFTLADPVDPTSARSFLDQPDRDPESARALIVRLITLFLDAHVRNDPQSASALHSILASAPPGIALARRK